MDFFWIAPLLLILWSSGQTTQASGSCQNCPVGYYKRHSCSRSTVTDFCEKCLEGSYKDKENVPKCFKCKECSSNQVVVEDCAYNHDRKCECKEGYYFDTICQPCRITDYDNQEYLKKCCQSQVCKKDPECWRRCNATNPPKTITASNVNESSSHSATRFTTATQATTTPGLTTPKSTKDPQTETWHLGFWYLFIVPLVATFLVFCWLLLLVSRKSCPSWSPSKDLKRPAQDPKSNERCSNQDSSPTSLTFDIPEETPMMSLGQKPPAHNSNHLLDSNGLGQDEQSGRWPAIVLYAIIREVPLRRWKEFLRLLSVADQQMERVELEAGLGSIEKQYQMLRLWSQHSSASLNDVYSSLHYMNLSGCAQLLQESLEKLQWRPEVEQGSTS